MISIDNSTSSNGLITGVKRKRLPWEMKGLDTIELHKMVGSGTFGLVFKAFDRETGDALALKKIKIDSNSSQGFPVTAIREIRILKSLKHENIIGLKEIITYKEDDVVESGKKDLFDSAGLQTGDIFMVFEYCLGDLSGLLKTKDVEITSDHVKCYMKQLLSGLHHLHLKKILHRDIKSANILITKNNVIKIADWGLARTYLEPYKQDFTNPVVTLWYRSPELLLGARKYSSEVDIWSAGCVFLEMKQRVAPLRAETEIQQLELIYQLCGYPTTPELLEKYRQYPDWAKYEATSTPSSSSFIPKLRPRYSSFSEYELSFAEKLLDIDPTKRITASDALNDDYFWHVRTPLPSELKPIETTEAITEHLVQKQYREDKAKEAEKNKQLNEEKKQARPEVHRRDHHGADPSGRGRIDGRHGRFDGRGGTSRAPNKSARNPPKYKILGNAAASSSDQNDKPKPQDP